jgi:hypothetical protein
VLLEARVEAEILPLLAKARKRGAGWVACCPVHADKNPSMVIDVKGDHILMHCFSCLADGRDVCEALHLSAGVLFFDRLNENRAVSVPSAVLEMAKEDLFFIEIYEQDKSTGARLSFNDTKRYRLAKERSKLITGG